MGFSTILFCNTTFNRCTFNNKKDVEDKLDLTRKVINMQKEKLKSLAIMTEPQKFYNSNPLIAILDEVEQCVEDLEYHICEANRLELLLHNWENCHTEDGLAIDPPEDFTYNTAYLWGDYVKSINNNE